MSLQGCSLATLRFQKSSGICYEEKNTKGRFSLPEFTGRVHGLSWRPENSGAFFDTRQLRPWTRVVETGRPCTRAVYTGVQFPVPELTARVDECQ